MSNQQNDQYRESRQDAGFMECPACGEIELHVEAATENMEMQTWRCRCGYIECHLNSEYKARKYHCPVCGARLSDVEQEMLQLEQQKQQWWSQQNDDEEWLNQHGENNG